jgi:UDP-glucose 4-epimerase
VSDVVKAFIGAMQHCKTGHDILNICTGKPTSINHLVSTIETLCGWRVQRIYEPARKGDIRISLGNPEKLQHLLGLQLSTSLEEGLTLTLDERKAAA